MISKIQPISLVFSFRKCKFPHSTVEATVGSLEQNSIRRKRRCLQRIARSTYAQTNIILKHRRTNQFLFEYSGSTLAHY